MTSAVSLVLAVPRGVGAAIFLAELQRSPNIFFLLTFVSDLLAAVPSVIYGLLGVFLLVPLMRTTIQPFLKKWFGFLPLFQGPAYGIGFLTAGIVLSIMIVPFVLSVSREVLLAVPRDQREAALALGATKWESTWRVVVPAARTGIFGSVFLALARGPSARNHGRHDGGWQQPGESRLSACFSTRLFDRRLRAGPTSFSEATGNLYLSALIELGLVLFLLTFVLNGLARLLDSGHHGARGAGYCRYEHPFNLLMAEVVLNVVMLSLTGLCALVTVARHCFLYSATWCGMAERTFPGTFSHDYPLPLVRPAAESANAIVGSLKLLLLAGSFRSSHWFARRCVPGRIWRASHAVSGALYGGPAERRAIDRDRHLRLRAGGDAHASLLDAGRRDRAGNHGDPHGFAQHGKFFARRADIAARRRFRAGRE